LVQTLFVSTLEADRLGQFQFASGPATDSLLPQIIDGDISRHPPEPGADPDRARSAETDQETDEYLLHQVVLVGGMALDRADGPTDFDVVLGNQFIETINQGAGVFIPVSVGADRHERVPSVMVVMQ